MALQESRDSAQRERAAWQEQGSLLAREVVAEEQRLQALQAQQASLEDQTGELERQQACTSAHLLPACCIAVHGSANVTRGSRTC